MDKHKQTGMTVMNGMHDCEVSICLLICFYDIDILSQSFSAESIITQTITVAL